MAIAWIHRWFFVRRPYPHLVGFISDHVRQYEFDLGIAGTSAIVTRPRILKPSSKVVTKNGTTYVLGLEHPQRKLLEIATNLSPEGFSRWRRRLTTEQSQYITRIFQERLRVHDARVKARKNA